MNSLTIERLTTERLTTERLTTERLTTERLTTERLTTERLTKARLACDNNGERAHARVWIEIRHPVTRRYIGKYCPQTQQLEVTDRGRPAVIRLPSK